MIMIEAIEMNESAQLFQRHKAKLLWVAYIIEPQPKKGTKILKQRKDTMGKIHALTDELILFTQKNHNEATNTTESKLFVRNSLQSRLYYS